MQAGRKGSANAPKESESAASDFGETSYCPAWAAIGSAIPREKQSIPRSSGMDCNGLKPTIYFPAVLIFSPKNFHVVPSNLAKRKVLNVE